MESVDVQERCSRVLGAGKKVLFESCVARGGVVEVMESSGSFMMGAGGEVLGYTFWRLEGGTTCNCWLDFVRGLLLLVVQIAEEGGKEGRCNCFSCT